MIEYRARNAKIWLPWKHLYSRSLRYCMMMWVRCLQDTSKFKVSITREESESQSEQTTSPGSSSVALRKQETLIALIFSAGQMRQWLHPKLWFCCDLNKNPSHPTIQRTKYEIPQISAGFLFVCFFCNTREEIIIQVCRKIALKMLWETCKLKPLFITNKAIASIWNNLTY